MPDAPEITCYKFSCALYPDVSEYWVVYPNESHLLKLGFDCYQHEGNLTKIYAGWSIGPSVTLPMWYDSGNQINVRNTICGTSLACKVIVSHRWRISQSKLLFSLQRYTWAARLGRIFSSINASCMLHKGFWLAREPQRYCAYKLEKNVPKNVSFNQYAFQKNWNNFVK